MPQLDSYIMLELPCSILIFFLISLLLNLKKIIIIFSSLRTKVLKVFVDKNLVSKLWKELKRWIKNYFFKKNNLNTNIFIGTNSKNKFR